MIQHIRTLTQYCEATWITHSHTRPVVQRPYVYRARKTLEEVEEARLQWALTGSLNTDLMPATDTHTMANGARESPTGPVHHHQTQSAGPCTLCARTIARNRHLCTAHTPTMSYLP